jgi:hypothetical protein
LKLTPAHTTVKVAYRAVLNVTRGEAIETRKM